PSKIELSDASVLRSTSVSSSRKIIVPWFRRAYSQLKMKVRALPTWRNPVGEGAKRTRGLPCEGGLRGSDIEFATEVNWSAMKRSSRPALAIHWSFIHWSLIEISSFEPP